MAFTQYVQGKQRKWKLDKNMPLADLIFSIDNSLLEKSSETSACQKCSQHTCEVFEVFCGKTSLHGIQYVGEKGNTILRLFWACIILLSLGTSIYYISQFYKKWQETPVVVTLAPTVKKIEEIYFPAVTICAPRILTMSSEMKFNNSSEENKRIIDKFCGKGNDENEDLNYSDTENNSALENYAHLSCETLLQQARFQNGHGTIKTYSHHVSHSKVLSGRSAIDCCTFNGLSEDVMYRNLNFTKNRNKNENSLLKPSGTGIRHSFKYELGVKIPCPSNLKLKVSIHHPSEEPDIEGYGLVVKTGSKISYTVKPQLTHASDSLKSVELKKRGCQFPEDVYLRFYRNYTQHNCLMDCLANYTLQKCNCLAPYLPENNGTLKLCRGKKLKECFNTAVDEFRDTESTNCKCEQPCAITTYLVTTQYVPSPKDDSKIEFDVYFTEPIFFSYYRSELYGLSDLLSNCGGLLGLFMGFSVISMIEVFYFSLFGIWRLFTGTFRRNR